MGEWQKECRQVLTLLSRVRNTGGGATSADFYSGLIEYNSDDVLTEALCFDSDQLTNMFERIFG